MSDNKNLRDYISIVEAAQKGAQPGIMQAKDLSQVATAIGQSDLGQAVSHGWDATKAAVGQGVDWAAKQMAAPTGKDTRTAAQKIGAVDYKAQQPGASAHAKARQGSASQRVVALQKRLIAKGARIKADGIMGPRTQAAMRQFGVREGVEETVERIIDLVNYKN